MVSFALVEDALRWGHDPKTRYEKKKKQFSVEIYLARLLCEMGGMMAFQVFVEGDGCVETAPSYDFF